MRAGGISENRLLRPLLGLACAVAIIVAGISGWARPWAYSQAYEIKAAAEASAETGRIRAARFYSFGENDRTIFIEDIAENGTDLDGIFIRTRKSDGMQVITASSGVFSYFAEPLFHRLQLKDAQVFRKVRDGTDISARFGSFTLLLAAQTPQDPGYKVKSASMRALRTSNDLEDKAEFQWRISTPISALLLAIAAIPLSRSRPRQGRYAKMLLALGIYAIYFNLLNVSRSWVEQGSFGFIWWVPALLALFVTISYFPIGRRKKGRSDA